jgi:molecular chaperone DnaJ
MIFSIPILAFIVALHKSDSFIIPFPSTTKHHTKTFTNFQTNIQTKHVNHHSRCKTSLQMASSTDNPYFKNMDSYQILEIPRSASMKEIKTAYRKLVSTWHPDKFPDDDAKKQEGNLRMEKINRAYFTIGDEDRKRRYDQYGEQGVGMSAASEEQLKAAGGPGMGGFGGQGGSVDVGDISDIFDQFFGGQGGGGRTTRQPRNANAPVAGDDLQVEVEIPFMTAIFGGQEKVKVRRLEECGTCGGTGIKPGAKSKTCSGCGGKGVVNNMQRTPFGVFNNVQTCPTCRGSGQEIEDYCPTCRGKGSTAETKEVTIRVPAGIDTGTSLRVKDSGNAGRRGGPRGDLFVEIRVKKDPKFRREGIDIYTEVDVPYYEAILGASVSADTVDGKTEVKIPAGTQPEQKLRLRGKGATKLGTDFRGDQFITVKVKIPTNVGGKEKELIESISKLGDKKGGIFGFGGN